MQQTDEGTTTLRGVYRRDLPGAGYVAIDVAESDDEGAAAGVRESSLIRLYVERRGSVERRIGHEPPILAELQWDDSATALAELYRTASDNVALARALLEWQTRRQGRREED